MTTEMLDICGPGRAAAEDFVRRHLSQLVDRALDPVPESEAADGPAMSSDGFRGGQSRADQALASLDLVDFTRNRTRAYPQRRRGASRLSPYIRHGLLDLPRVWNSLSGPDSEVERFRLELLWQEYARHLYARLGSTMKQPLRFEPPQPRAASGSGAPDWDRSMGCMEITTGELDDDGWLVGQARLWLASQWAVRQRRDWRLGEDYFFRHLLDGSRASNLLGWQMAIGTATGRPYNFSRWQVESRAPGLCAGCERNSDCPIDRWPDAGRRSGVPVDRPLLRFDPDVDRTGGPSEPRRVEDGRGNQVRADVVWITAESIGDCDPALVANPDLPVVFVFDRPLLSKLRLSAKRLVFLTETLAELATKRAVEIHLGSPAEALAGRRVAVTFAPVPGWRRHARTVDPVEIHPWPWLRRPGSGDISSFSLWNDRYLGLDAPAGHNETTTDLVLDSTVSAIPVAMNMR